MDPSDLLSIIRTYVDIRATTLAVVATQLVKFLLPSPDGTVSMQVIPGKITTRLLPILPLAIGAVFCLGIDKDNPVLMDRVIRGLMSGTLAAYLYRTTTVSIFGK